jgi:uncharacterized protein YndB with AHSA1/START domain
MEQELSITRVIKHPRETVFEAWTKREHLQKWFAPRGCTIIFVKLTIRTGGEFHWGIKNPKYPDCWCIGEFLEIEHPSIIRYKIRLADDTGNPMSSQEVFKDKNWPEETFVTVTFNEVNGHTELTIRQTVTEALAKKTGAYHGWIEMLDILDEQLSLTPETFKA